MTLFGLLDTVPKAMVVLKDGSVYTGSSLGVMPAEDDDGDDLGFDEIMFKPDGESGIVNIRETDIVSVDPV